VAVFPPMLKRLKNEAWKITSTGIGIGCPMMWSSKLAFNYLYAKSIIITTYAFCGKNGQGNPVDNLYSLRVKSTLTRHKQKHLHLYQINGRSSLGSSGANLIRVETRISNNFM
jgi:hypothetical protein